MGGFLSRSLKGVGSMNYKLKINQKIMEIFWVFIAGSLVGFLYESLLCVIQRGHLESRQGLVYGPFTPVYGIGAVVLMLILFHKKNIIAIFCISAFAGGIIEYIFSLLQEFFFGTISWDYHNKFNVFGRTSLFHSLIWGLLGIVFIKLFLPYFLKILHIFKECNFKMITFIMMLFMAFDIIISWGAASRQDERTHHIPSNSMMDQFFDEHFPDERMNKIYVNKKVVRR